MEEVREMLNLDEETSDEEVTEELEHYNNVLEVNIRVLKDWSDSSDY